MEILGSSDKKGKDAGSIEGLETLQKYHSERRLQGNGAKLDLTRRIWRWITKVEAGWRDKKG